MLSTKAEARYYSVVEWDVYDLREVSLPGLECDEYTAVMIGYDLFRDGAWNDDDWPLTICLFDADKVMRGKFRLELEYEPSIWAEKVE